MLLYAAYLPGLLTSISITIIHSQWHSSCAPRIFALREKRCCGYNHTVILSRVIRFYADGFRSMTLGRTLWCIILIKLFIMFAVLRVFFFPAHLQGDEQEKQQRVSDELTERIAP